MPSHSFPDLDRFRSALMSPDAPRVRDARLQIAADAKLSMFYAPFEHSNHSARLILVGITPGPTQMANALQAIRAAKAAGRSDAEAMAEAKTFASFSGEPMRSNLIAQLNHWGVHDWLGLPDSVSLFGDASNLVHYTSLLRNPVFVGTTGYNGSPDMMRHPILQAQILENFVPEMQLLDKALILGLGPKVHAVLDRLASMGKIPRDRYINGLLHPSGQNSYRIRYLVGDQRSDPPHMTNAAPYNAGRRKFQQQKA